MSGVAGSRHRPPRAGEGCASRSGGCSTRHGRRTGAGAWPAQLNRDGVEVSVGTVAGIMRELRLCAVQPRAYKRTTIAGDVAAIPDLIDRDFTAQVPGARLVGDITYLRTSEDGCIWRR